jgi:DNA-binding transcriptional ArsR family regulator
MAQNSKLILAPPTVQVRIELEPVLNVLDSFVMLNLVEEYTGLGGWVTRTFSALTPEERHQNKLLLGWFEKALLPQLHMPSFPAYLAHLSKEEPATLIERTLRKQAEHHREFGGTSVEELMRKMKSDFDFWKSSIEPCHLEEWEASGAIEDVYALIQNPEELKELALSHLRKMWDQYLAEEWKQVLPMLKECIAAHQEVDYSDMTAAEAIRKVAGRDLKDNSKHADWNNVRTITFVPSAHVGPYVVIHHEDDNLKLLFGARAPKGVSASLSELNRSDLLVRLLAISDDIRLQILKLLKHHQELYAQDVISLLGISQSSASRHLIQLAATGYLEERRKERGKCYSLRATRVDETFNDLKRFLDS